MKNKNKGGRPTKCTKELMRRVTELAARGLNQSQMSKILRVKAQLLSEWKSMYPEFLAHFERGIAIGVERRLARIERAAKRGSYQADIWYLERVHYKQFGKKERHELTGDNGGPIATKDETPLPQISRSRLLEIVGNEAEQKNGKTNGC